VEETIAEALLQSEALRQSILKKAFEGKLVPQDPSDPPASELLEKIKMEREGLRRAGPPASELLKKIRTEKEHTSQSANQKKGAKQHPEGGL